MCNVSLAGAGEQYPASGVLVLYPWWGLGAMPPTGSCTVLLAGSRGAMPQRGPCTVPLAGARGNAPDRILYCTLGGV